jgi:hypothetical protein
MLRIRRLLVLLCCLGSLIVGVSPAAAAEVSMFGSARPANPSDPDTSATQLGVVFRASSAGRITAIRFYKGSGNTGTHVGSLWSSSGTRLAQVTFTGETASGWQTARFSTPVSITANTNYVASYHTTTGHYSGDVDYFSAGKTAGTSSLTATASRYGYGAAGTFPTQTYRATNYYVDVLYTTATTQPAPPAPPAAPTASFSYTPSSPQPGKEVTFNANASSCPATPCTYTWQDVGPNGTDNWALGTGQTMRFTFKNPGTKYVQLAVKDAQNRTATTTHNLTVQTA